MQIRVAVLRVLRPHAAPDNDGATADDNAPAEAAAETETSCATVRR